MTGPTARTSESDFQLYKNLETFSRVTNYATLTGRPESAKLQDTDFLPSVRHMVAGTNESIRIANPTDFDAVTALLVASYSSLLAAHYDSNTLSRALPYLTAANPTLLASDTYYVVEGELGRLVGCGGWTAAEPGSGKIIEGEAHIRHLATHP